MGAIRTNAAAAMLGVSPNTLRSWERRFGYPEPRRTAGGHRQFDLNEIEALRSAFEETHNISSAVALARERGAGPATPSRLRSAFARFDEVDADRVLEESLAVRSVERTVEEVLLPGVESLDPEGRAPPRSTASRGAGPPAGWPRRPASRRRPPATTACSSSTPARRATWTALHAQALELCLRRRGLRVLTLTMALDPGRLSRALQALEPRAVVLTGRRASLDALGRLVFAARRTAGDGVTVYDFRGALPSSGPTTVPRLGDSPLAATERLLAARARSRVSESERRLLAVGGRG